MTRFYVVNAATDTNAKLNNQVVIHVMPVHYPLPDYRDYSIRRNQL